MKTAREMVESVFYDQRHVIRTDQYGMEGDVILTDVFERGISWQQKIRLGE